MMRCWLLMLLLAAVSGGEPAPTLTRSSTATLQYDAKAAAPWMPLLWEDLLVTVPGEPRAVAIEAQLYKPNDDYGYSIHDMLSLRSGHGVMLDGDDIAVDGLHGTWSGLAMGSGVLRADLGADATARHAYLLLRQLHFANFSDVPSSTTRRMRVRILLPGTDPLAASAWAIVNIRRIDGEGTPLLRCDPIALTVGQRTDLRPTAWYDSRPSTPLAWLLGASSPASLSVVDGIGDVTTALRTAPAGQLGHPIGDFAARDLELLASVPGGGSLQLTVLTTATQKSTVTLSTTAVGAATGGIMLGNLPLQVTAGHPVVAHLCTDMTGTWTASVLAHPLPDLTPDASCFVPGPVADGILPLTITLSGATGLRSGILVLSNGATEVRLPFRIMVHGASDG